MFHMLVGSYMICWLGCCDAKVHAMHVEMGNCGEGKENVGIDDKRR